MATLRRRIVRPIVAASQSDRQRLEQVRAALNHERVALAGRLSRLKRAFHAFEKQQQRIVRLERRIRQLEIP